jgi:hypothetical protein
MVLHRLLAETGSYELLMSAGLAGIVPAGPDSGERAVVDKGVVTSSRPDGG